MQLATKSSSAGDRRIVALVSLACASIAVPVGAATYTIQRVPIPAAQTVAALGMSPDGTSFYGVINGNGAFVGQRERIYQLPVARADVVAD